MGVRGLKSFIEKNDDLFIRGHQLHDTLIIIDANNLVCVLVQLSQEHERRDLFGGDMVKLGSYINRFFDNLKRCNITPVLVFDGAQTHDENKSKTAEKHRRAVDRFQTVLSINKCGFGDFILPASSTNVFRSIAVDRNIKIIQCMFEADLEIARLAHEHKCPVISNDSDFFLINLPSGLLPINLMDHEHVKHSSENDNSYFYIECSLFKQENFANYCPNLDVRNLPLVGVLAGNDFVDGQLFEQVCSQFPKQNYSHQGSRDFRRTKNRQHERILRIIHFLCDKSLSETINQVCSYVPSKRRSELKGLIQRSLDVYSVPAEDDFRQELSRIYRPGFEKTFKRSISNIEELNSVFQDKIDQLVDWLKRAMEKSVLGYRCLEIANRNPIFIICHMEDPGLPSAHRSQVRAIAVQAALLKSSTTDTSPCFVYDREGTRYKRFAIKPLRYLHNFGDLTDITFFDLPTMVASDRRAILMAAFHYSTNHFDTSIIEYYYWLEADHAEEFLAIKILMDSVDIESTKGSSHAPPVKLWKHFRHATLFCVLYHYYKERSDQTFLIKLEETERDESMQMLADIIRRRHFDRAPNISKKRRYNCRLMHQITQLHSSIISFNGLNAMLGDIMTRIRQERWLNSCIIYNLAEALHERTLRLPDTMPMIVYEPIRSGVEPVQIAR